MMLGPVVLSDEDRVYLVEQIQDAQEACEIMGDALCQWRSSIEHEQEQSRQRSRIDLERARAESPFKPWEA